MSKFNGRIILDDGEMFDGDIQMFEDAFGGVQGSIGGVVRYCYDHGHKLETVRDGVKSSYSIWKEEDGKVYYDTDEKGV